MKEQWFEAIERHIPTGEVRTRFGPSPTGYMHVGNLRTAIYAWLIARRAGGKFLLRIEDTDQVRQVEGAVEIICRTLRQCGLSWDEGPDVGGPVGPYVQTARRELYLPYAELLVERGCAYRCFCEKMEPEEECGVFDRGDDPCRALSPAEVRANLHAGRPYVIRQRIPRQGRTTFHDLVFGEITVDNRTLDDQILIKRDGLPTYNFANVIDDHLMGITHVVRGSEYLSSAPKYDLLYQSFGWKIPHYVHCAPVMRDQKHKLSKRHGDPSYEDLLAMGYLSDAIVNYVALLGWAPTGEQKEREFFRLEELAEYFDIAGLSKSPAIFDLNKLNYFNACYLRALPPRGLFRRRRALSQRDGAGLPGRFKAGGTTTSAPLYHLDGYRAADRLSRRAPAIPQRALPQRKVARQREEFRRTADPDPLGARGFARLDRRRPARRSLQLGCAAGSQARDHPVAAAHCPVRQGGYARRSGGTVLCLGARRIAAPYLSGNCAAPAGS